MCQVGRAVFASWISSQTAWHSSGVCPSKRLYYRVRMQRCNLISSVSIKSPQIKRTDCIKLSALRHNTRHTAHKSKWYTATTQKTNMQILTHSAALLLPTSLCNLEWRNSNLNAKSMNVEQHSRDVAHLSLGPIEGSFEIPDETKPQKKEGSIQINTPE